MVLYSTYGWIIKFYHTLSLSSSPSFQINDYSIPKMLFLVKFSFSTELLELLAGLSTLATFMLSFAPALIKLTYMYISSNPEDLD